MQTQRQSILRLPTVDVTLTGARVVGLLTLLILPIRQKRAHREHLYSWMQTRERLIERNVSPAEQSDLSLLVLTGRSNSRLNSAGSILGPGRVNGMMRKSMKWRLIVQKLWLPPSAGHDCCLQLLSGSQTTDVPKHKFSVHFDTQ